MAFTSKLIMIVMVFLIVGVILSMIGASIAHGVTEVNNALQLVFKNGHWLLIFFISLAGAIKFADEVRRGDIDTMDLVYLCLAVGGAIFLYGSRCTNVRIGCPLFQTVYSLSSVSGVEIPTLAPAEATLFGYLWAIVIIALGVAFALRYNRRIPKIF